MGVGEDPVGEDSMDIDAPAWPPAGMEAADEGVIREGDPGDFYMKVIAKKFRGGYMALDDDGPGAVETPIRLVGSASAAWEDAVDFKDRLEKLLDDVRPVALGGSWPTRRRRFATATSPGFTGGGGGDGETSRDNSFFVYKMLKQVPDADPPPYTTEELESEEELPRNLLAEREDAKYTTMVAQAQHFYLATPPPPPGADSDDSRASARPIRAALCTVAVLMAPADMSSAKAADLGVDAGELRVAGIHARSHDALRAKCKCYTPVCPTQ
eukprot:jgi/Tetstr1/424788/TSEL_001485.t1